MSDMKVEFYNCKECGVRKRIDPRTPKKTPYCSNCVGGKMFRLRWAELYEQHKNDPITVEMCLTLLDRTHTAASNTAFYIGRKNIKNSEAIKLLAPFGWRQKPKSTEDLRKVVLNKIMQDRSLLLMVVSQVIKKTVRKRLSGRQKGEMSITKNRITVGKVAPWFRASLDVLGFSYSGNRSETSIHSGSFFIDGRWIHVG